MEEKLYIGDSFHDIYLYNIEEHISNYMFINSPRGFEQKERLCSVFKLTNPVERVCYTEERRANIIHLFAEVLWYLKGTRELDFIAYYCPSMRKFSKDGKTLLGSAYGDKIFNWQGHLDQWNCVFKQLQEDKDSKRAVINIRNPEEMEIEGNIDATCTLSLQFLIREEKLHLFTNMRANDVYVGALSDVFAFTFLLELMATQLNIDVGDYYHMVASTHLYKPNYKMAEKLIYKSKKRKTYEYSFPKLPLKDNWADISIVLDLEEKLRLNQMHLTIEEIEALNIDVYWRQVVCLLNIQNEIIYSKEISKKSYNYLLDIYQHFISNRFGEYINF